MQLKLVAKTFHHSESASAIGSAPFTNRVRLLEDTVSVKVTLISQTGRKLPHSVNPVLIGLHCGEERLMPLDQVLSLLQIGLEKRVRLSS